MKTTDALDLLASFVMPDDCRLGQMAEAAQWVDFGAVLDTESATPYHFLTRARGRSKTSDLAAIVQVAIVAQLRPGSRCYAVAADRDQGRLLLDAFRGFAERTPSLEGRFVIGAFKATDLETGSTLEILAADASGSWGLRPDFVVIDEVANWPSTSQPKVVFEAITSAVAKVPGCRLVLLTSAGEPAHWSYKVLEHAKADPMWRVNELWGPAPWMSKERLEEQRRRLPESSFQRLFLNEWTASEDRLTSLDDLRACVVLDGPLDPERGVRYVISLDLGLKRDRTVAVVAHAEHDQRKPGQRKVILDRIEVWQGTRTNPVKVEAVERWLLQAHRQFNGARIVLDPWQAIGLAQRLRDRGVRVEEFTFSSGSVGRLASGLHLALRNQALALPDDKELLDELANVRLRETSPGVLRMDHDPDQHDDRAVAVALCVQALSSAPPQVQAVTPIVVPKADSWLIEQNEIVPASLGLAGDDGWDW